MPYTSNTRTRLWIIAGIFVLGLVADGLLVLRRHQNAAPLTEFRGDSACMARLVAGHPVHSTRCNDDSAVVVGRWTTRNRSRTDYYLALRLGDGTVDTTHLRAGREPWEKAQVGAAFVVRRFAPRGGPRPRVVALVGDGAAADALANPIARDDYLQWLMVRASIALLGSLALLALVLVVERVPKGAEA